MSVSEFVDPITTQKQLNSAYYFHLVSFSLLFYDYFLTLDWEIERYWGTQLTWPSFFYFVNRYGTLFGNIPVVIEYFWSTPPTPRKLMVLVGAMLILRTYALYERNKRVLALMLAFTTGSVAVGIWSVATGKSDKGNVNLELYFGCNYPISRDAALSTLIPWAAVAVFDTMIFFLTLGRVLYRRSITPRSSMDLLSILLRDGAIYFGVMVMSNLANILTFVLGTPYTRGIATTFTNILASILISRLMLNLRDPALAHMSGRARGQTGSTTLTMGPTTRLMDAPDVMLDTEYELSTQAPNYDKPDPYIMSSARAV
ncbi:hypothetical protein MIND_01348900 [Mycena indigotica]|uniref:DUF6533 domain-containing protein n=1 Tax=Mycena indigotica TaxID=2126181 RepID=A0A8H6RZE5_9AGAR|nr:uncharacterized protein MIND_01348900 [Mycena indigotica]KAF7289753.1 hypothetical protein MIND_01348900 [Mycena indigotica]